MMAGGCKNTLFHVLGSAFCVCVLCTFTETEQAGNSTQTGNGYMIIGRLFEPDGVTPASQTLVEVRNKGVIAEINTGMAKQMSDDFPQTVTDEQGYYGFSALPEGLYVVEGVDDDNNMVLIDSVNIAHSEESRDLGDDTLRPPGVVRGSVILPNGGYPGQVFILAFGLDRFCKVNDDGTFLFSHLPRGTYTLRVISLDPQYGFADIEGVHISSDSITVIDSIILPVSELGIPVVEARYDTLEMNVALSWTRVPGNAGYNLYRITLDTGYRVDPFLSPALRVLEYKGYDTFDYPINQKMLYKDTFYVDSMINGYKLPEGTYYVAAVDSFGNEWNMSEPVTVQYYSPFQVVDTLYMENFPGYTLSGSDDPMRVFVTADDMFIFDGKTTEETYCFSFHDETGRLLFRKIISETAGQEEIRLFEQPFDSKGTYYFARIKPDSVLLQTVTVHGETNQIIHMISSDSQMVELRGYYRMEIMNDCVLIRIDDELVVGHYDIKTGEYESWESWSWDANDSAMFFEKFGTVLSEEYLISEYIPEHNLPLLMSDSLAFTRDFSRTRYYRYTESGTVDTGRVLPDFGNWANWTSYGSVVTFIPGGAFLEYAFVE